MHDEEWSMPHISWLLISHLVQEYNSVSNKVGASDMQYTNFRWLPPFEGWVKLNMNGASKNLCIAGPVDLFEVLMENECVFSKLALDRGFRRIELHVNSLVVVNSLKSNI